MYCVIVYCLFDVEVCGFGFVFGEVGWDVEGC